MVALQAGVLLLLLLLAPLGARLRWASSRRRAGRLQNRLRSRSGLVDTSVETSLHTGVNDLHNFWFGYRYLQIGNDTQEDGVTYSIDMMQPGPTIGWAYTFK